MNEKVIRNEKKNMEEIKIRELIGRDKLIKNHIYPRVRKELGFVLSGQRGIGKTELLKWAYFHYEGEKLYISCNETYGETIKKIAELQGVDQKGKTIALLEKEVMRGREIALFIDDIEKMKPKQAVFFTAWNGWNKCFLAGVEPYREEAKKLLWGKQKIKVNTIEQRQREELAVHIIKKLGSLVPKEVISMESKGIPGRAWAIAKGEFVREDDERVKGEEVNIAEVLLILVAVIMITRYIGMGTGQRDIYIIGGIGMAFAYLLRIVIRIIK